jgi:hypothetical protein
MRTKADSLQLIIGVALKPLENADYSTVAASAAREADPLWQVGHAGFDACRALVSPFERDRALEQRFATCFHGTHSVEPWNADRPDAPSVFAWWREILTRATRNLTIHGVEEGLPEPIRFTAYTVHTVGEAYDYVIYHTSFHAGLAQAAVVRQ